VRPKFPSQYEFLILFIFLINIHYEKSTLITYSLRSDLAGDKLALLLGNGGLLAIVYEIIITINYKLYQENE
jgi:hypothetical protein